VNWFKQSPVITALNAGCAALLCCQQNVLAVPYKGPEPPSKSAESARAKKLLLAVVDVEPSSFDWDGKHIFFESAWIQRTKYEKLTYLCFVLKGVKPKEYLEFRRIGPKEDSFSQCWDWLDGHCVFQEDLRSPENIVLPKTMEVSFYGHDGTLHNRPAAAGPFIFSVRPVEAEGKHKHH
jgi:hypothetical protein